MANTHVTSLKLSSGKPELKNSNYYSFLSKIISNFIVSINYLNISSASFILKNNSKIFIENYPFSPSDSSSKSTLIAHLGSYLSEDMYSAAKDEKSLLDVILLDLASPDLEPFLQYDLLSDKAVYNLEPLLLNNDFIPYFSEAVKEVNGQNFEQIHQINLISQEQLEHIHRNLHTLSPKVSSNFTSLNDLFKSSFKTYRKNIAYHFKDLNITYEELDHYSNYYASELLNNGISKGDLVFVFIENGLELPVAYLTCIKIGAVFAPLDSKWPSDRLVSLEAKFRPKTILSNPNQDTSLFQSKVTPLILDSNHKDISAPELNISPSDKLYAFFTSGSTGTPKCAVNRHDGLINRFQYMTKIFKIDGKSDVVLQNSSQIFDSSLWQLLWPLLNGDTIIIPQRKTYPDMDYTLNLIEEYKVTMTDFVPSIFNLMVASLKNNQKLKSKLKSLKRIIVGGEESSASHLKEFNSIFPEIQLINTYGHTEASIGMVFHLIEPKHIDKEVPLGKPIDNTYVVIADKNHRAKPVGAIGYIYVAGVCVGEGYLGEHTKNDSTFYNNPFPHIPEKKIFNTGDIGYLGSDGLLYYKGRKDYQIKIGGIRLNLKEIEWAIEQHPSVDLAKVFYKKKHQSLYAFVKLSHKITLDELLEFINQKLPKYAVPHTIMIVKEFPLNNNDKINEEKLFSNYLNNPKNRFQKLQVSDPYDPLKKSLVDKWKILLNTEHIPEHKSYFDLGGSSLSAISMLVNLESEFNMKINLEEVYNNITIENLYRLLKKNKGINVAIDQSDLLQNVMLDDFNSLTSQIDKITPTKMSESIRGVFITGATGFFGSLLLHNLIYNTNYKLYCLVRAQDEEKALAKIKNGLKVYCEFSLTNALISRIEVLCGNLDEPNFGLCNIQFNHLSNNADLIIHNGADVNFLKDYKNLRTTNVMSLESIVKLATTNILKPIHYISSVSVVSNSLKDAYDSVPETIDYDFDLVPRDSGYSQTKWMLEKTLTYFGEHINLPYNIYRFDEIGASSITGIANNKSLFHSFLKSICIIGMAPNVECKIDYHPGDKAAQFIIEQISTSKNQKCYNMISHKELSLNKILEKLSEEGKDIKKVDYHIFKQALNENSVINNNCFVNTINYALPNASNIKDPLKDAFFNGWQKLDNQHYKELSKHEFLTSQLDAYVRTLVKTQNRE